LIIVLVLLFLVAVIVIYISEKKKEKQNFCLRRYCSLAAAVLFKTEFLVELGIGLLFSKGKRRSE
jgi:uncharacterized membrane protein